MVKMKFGEYKDTPMDNIPAAYLIKIYNFNKLPKRNRQYIKENYEALQSEVEANSIVQMNLVLVKMETKTV